MDKTGRLPPPGSRRAKRLMTCNVQTVQPTGEALPRLGIDRLSVAPSRRWKRNWRVPHHHASRTVTMPTSLATALASHLAHIPGELVFPNRSGGLRRYRTFLRDSWDPAARTAGLTVTPHDVRATCASLLIDAGASIKHVQAQSGHQDPITNLALYARVRPGRADVLAVEMDALIAVTL
jgi:integrase